MAREARRLKQPLQEAEDRHAQPAKMEASPGRYRADALRYADAAQHFARSGSRRRGALLTAITQRRMLSTGKAMSSATMRPPHRRRALCHP